MFWLFLRAVKPGSLLRGVAEWRKNTVIQHSVVWCCILLMICTDAVSASEGMARITPLFQQGSKWGFSTSNLILSMIRKSLGHRVLRKAVPELISPFCSRFLCF